ncbi:unnamed protein product, partial [Rangifer tarandus platyrhynchus]
MRTDTNLARDRGAEPGVANQPKPEDSPTGWNQGSTPPPAPHPRECGSYRPFQKKPPARGPAVRPRQLLSTSALSAEHPAVRIPAATPGPPRSARPPPQ